MTDERLIAGARNLFAGFELRQQANSGNVYTPTKWYDLDPALQVEFVRVAEAIADTLVVFGAGRESVESLAVSYHGRVDRDTADYWSKRIEEYTLGVEAYERDRT